MKSGLLDVLQDTVNTLRELKSNPYHDSHGRFARAPSGGGNGSGSNSSGTERAQEAGGECYKDAAKAVVYGASETQGWKDIRLVQGYPTLQSGSHKGEKFGHAWVEGSVPIKNTKQTFSMVYDASKGTSYPKQLYYKVGKIDPSQSKSYTKNQALANMLKTSNWGPWGKIPDGVNFSE